MAGLVGDDPGFGECVISREQWEISHSGHVAFLLINNSHHLPAVISFLCLTPSVLGRTAASPCTVFYTGTCVKEVSHNEKVKADETETYGAR